MLPQFSRCWCISLDNIKIHLLITTNVIRQFLKVNTSCLRWQMQVFQNANLNLKLYILFLTTDMLLSRWITSFILKIATKYPIWAITVNHCFKSIFSWCDYCILVGSRSVSCVFLISSHETLKSNDLKINIYYC